MDLLAVRGGAGRLPLVVYQVIARILYRAESAVRRLIVVAARGLEVPLSVSRPMPPGLIIAGKGSRAVFQLFDARKSFSDLEAAQAITGPRIRSVDEADPRSLFLAKFATPAESFVSDSETLRLRNRLDAVQRALRHLSREAKRMARWMKRRAAMVAPPFTSPLRPGRAPGHRKQSRDEIDLVLAECHGLAWDVLRDDSS